MGVRDAARVANSCLMACLGLPIRMLCGEFCRIDLAPGQPSIKGVGASETMVYWIRCSNAYATSFECNPSPRPPMTHNPTLGSPGLYVRSKYRQRIIIECIFGWPKDNRRIVTRYDKLSKSYAPMVSQACSIWCFPTSIFVQNRTQFPGVALSLRNRLL